MAGRYSKLHSNYILKSHHQYVKGGRILERDWVTIGGQHQIEKGKKLYYSDSNFLFTDNSYPSYKKRYNYGKWVAHWDYEDVKNSRPDTNNVVVNENSDDIRDFAYYGSAVELVRSSIYNIINWFPAQVTVSNDEIYIPNGTEGYYQLEGYYLLNNPFNIDFVHELNNNSKQIYNENRFLINSYKNYTSGYTAIESYEAINRNFMFKQVTINITFINVDGENNELGRYTTPYTCEFWQMFTDEEMTAATANGWKTMVFCGSTWLPNMLLEKDYHGDKDFSIKYVNEADRIEQLNQHGQTVIKSYQSKVDGITAEKNFPLYTIKINGGDKVEGYIIDDQTIQLTNDSKLSIKPKKEIFEEYFNNLKGFEKQLLTLYSKPLYKNSFLTPIEGELAYKYVYRDYTWPSTYDEDLGYAHIDITSQTYVSFVQRLIDMATVFDELWCDNLYRNMTHESIKNFDWTYTKDYNEGEEQDNIDGGNRVMQLLRIYGRAFDDIKRLADGIGFVTSNTYNGFNNQPDAEISDRLEMAGWDIVSVIPPIEGVSDIVIDTNQKWFDSTNPGYFNAATFDIEFMRRLILSSNRIFKTKGTQHAIDMVMGMFGFGDSDYELTEKCYYIDIKELKKYDEWVEKVENINFYKNHEKHYDDIYSGVPLNDIFIDGEHYIVPYYTQTRIYDGDLVFESNGGWGKRDNGEYMETLSYLHVVSDFEELLDINPNSLHDGDIYYVTSLVSYVNYKSETAKSHFFYLKEGGKYNPQLPESWSDIDTDKDSDIAKKANYLDRLISTNIGNNPHTGYGNYDEGEEYRKYMEQPFKYAVDDDESLPDENLKKEAKDFTFKIQDKEGIKIVNFIKYDENKNPIKEDKYYLNRKWFKIKNNLDNALYKEYFRNVILHYLMQVIPSTTILILENFD